MGPGPELEDEWMRKSHNIFDSFLFIYALNLRFGLEKVIDFFDLYPPSTRDHLPLKIIIINNSSKKVVCTPF